MADCNLEYLFVSNIPRTFPAVSVRHFFSEFTETFGFECFHYVHRLELQKRSDDKNELLTAEELVLDVGDNIDAADGNWFECRTSFSDSFSNSQHLKCVRLPLSLAKVKNAGDCTCCCVICVKQPVANKLLQMYNKKYWCNKKGVSFGTRCLINRIKLHPNDCSQSLLSGPRAFTKDDLYSLRELCPPREMPHGNVGTPMRVFLKLMEMGELPPRVSVSLALGLKFPKLSEQEKKELNKRHRKMSNDIAKVPRTAIKDISAVDIKLEVENEAHTEGGLFDVKTADNQDTVKAGSEQSGKVLESSVAKVPRQRSKNKLRKGLDKKSNGTANSSKSSSLNELRKTIQGGKQKKIKKKKLGKKGKDAEDTIAFSPFDFTKGIGRKLMEKYGWQEGQGLGKLAIGITKPIVGVGQPPGTRKGLGFIEEKLSRNQRKKKRGKKGVSISTVPDKIDTAKTTPEVLPPSGSLIVETVCNESL